MSVLQSLLDASPRGSASELARRLGIDRASVTRWAKGDNLDGLRLSQLKIIANFFEIPVYRLLGVPIPLSDAEKACLAAFGRMPSDKRETFLQIGEAMAGPDRRSAASLRRGNDNRRW